MTDIKFFQKSNMDNDQIQDILKALSIASNNNIIPNKYCSLLEQKITTESQNNQGSIQRQDLLNFSKNIGLIISNQEFKNFYINKTQNISLNRNELEIAYEYIAILNDCIKELQENQKQLTKQNAEQEKIKNLRKKEDNERETQLSEMENLLNEL